MALPTINIPNFAGASTAVPVANSGRQAATDSSAVVLSNEDLAALGALTETAPASDTASSGLNGRLQRIAQRLSSLIALLPASLGTKAAAASLPVTLASDGQFVTTNGSPSDAAWASGNGTLVALLKAIAANAVSTADSPVEVHQPCDVISFTPTLDTAAYASGDVLFATAALTLARANDKAINLQSLNVIDKSKQHPAFTVFYYQTNVTSAAANAANALSDSDAINCLGFVRIAAADWIDLANNSFACYKGSTAPNLVLKPATGTQIVYAVGILDAGTPTFAVGDLVLKLGVVQQ